MLYSCAKSSSQNPTTITIEFIRSKRLKWIQTWPKQLLPLRRKRKQSLPRRRQNLQPLLRLVLAVGRLDRRNPRPDRPQHRVNLHQRPRPAQPRQGQSPSRRPSESAITGGRDSSGTARRVESLLVKQFALTLIRRNLKIDTAEFCYGLAQRFALEMAAR